MMEHDDFAQEPVNGLPEAPPAGEQILWQGRPNTWALARQAFGLNWVVGYFILLAVWRLGISSIDMGFAAALPLAIPFLALGVLAGGVIFAMAWVQTRVTVYTITNERIALRVGAALTVTVNLPFSKIEAADLDLRQSGIGTIVFQLPKETRLSYVVLWPHVRPWHMRAPQPALRAIPDAARVASLLADLVETRDSTPQIATPRSAAGAPIAAE